MLQSNSRIERFRGIRFYEQDVIYDDYVFAEDIQITMNADYVSPGIGIALISNEGASVREKNELYLFRFGYKEASVNYRIGEISKKLLNVAVNMAPVMEDMKFVFKKVGRIVSISVNDHVLYEFPLPKRMDKYNIGIYSNAGNIIKNISVASLVPNNWVINMTNTNGGYIKFLKNSFELEGCKYNAEIEQQDIELKAGTYFVKYDKENIGGINDMKCFVFNANDTRIHDTEKNLIKDGKFTLEVDSVVNLKFKGKQGVIKNISITDRLSDRYVPSRNDQTEINGSYIDVDLNKIKQIKWTGVIIDTPDELSEAERESFAIIADAKNNISLSEAGVITGKSYNYEYVVKDYMFKVYDGTTLINSILMTNVNMKITIFRNMNAVITQLTLIQTDDQVINLIVERTTKKYVPGSIASPIVVVDGDNTPLDLSASYRSIETDGVTQYIFTNVEREVFTPDTHIKTASKISKQLGSVVIYGIPLGAAVNEQNLYKIPAQGMDNINEYCQTYDVFHEADIYYMDRATGDIYLNDIDDYQLLIVDYLKQDSYCINYIPEMKMYEVDISTDKDNISVMYDHSNDQGRLSNISNYKMTEFSPQENCYIVLRREDF